MPFNRLTAMLATAVAPMLWGTTYLVFTQTLPVDHPLLVGALRALPAGVLLMLLGPGLPPRNKLLPLLPLPLHRAVDGSLFASTSPSSPALNECTVMFHHAPSSATPRSDATDR